MSTKKAVNPVTLYVLCSDGVLRPAAAGTDGALTFTLETGDIEIGAVELKDGGTDQRASVDTSGNLAVKQPDGRATGTINSATSNAAYSVALDGGRGVVSFNVAGLTASDATLAIEASDDGGTTWAAVNGIAPSTGALFSTLTADQQFRVNAGGRTNVRLRVSATGTGNISVASSAASVSSTVAMSSPLPGGTNVVGKVGIDQTTPGTTNGVVVNSQAGTRVPGTIATGGVANAAKIFGVVPTNGYEVINTHATETLYINESGTAAIGDNGASEPIKPFGSYTTPQGYKPTGDVSVIAATTGHAFIARRW